MLPIFREHLLQQERRERNINIIRRRKELRERSDPFELPKARFVELFQLNKEYVYILYRFNIIINHSFIGGLGI